MDQIKRTGPPTPTGIRGSEYEVSVPLNASPSVDWRRAFQAPEEWKEPFHPSRIRVRDRTLMFSAEESQVPLWIERIDGWIAAANDRCAAGPGVMARRQSAQADDERELQRRLQEATERFRTL